MKNANLLQQKGRRVPIQLQDQVDEDIGKQLKEGHIERVDKIQVDIFFLPTVIPV